MASSAAQELEQARAEFVVTGSFYAYPEVELPDFMVKPRKKPDAPTPPKAVSQHYEAPVVHLSVNTDSRIGTLYEILNQFVDGAADAGWRVYVATGTHIADLINDPEQEYARLDLKDILQTHKKDLHNLRWVTIQHPPFATVEQVEEYANEIAGVFEPLGAQRIDAPPYAADADPTQGHYREMYTYGMLFNVTNLANQPYESITI